MDMTNRKYNQNWDRMLTPYQRQLISKPGFGILQQLPYLDEEEVQRVMTIIEDCVRHLELLTNDKFSLGASQPENCMIKKQA